MRAAGLFSVSWFCCQLGYFICCEMGSLGEVATYRGDVVFLAAPNFLFLCLQVFLFHSPCPFPQYIQLDHPSHLWSNPSRQGCIFPGMWLALFHEP